MSLSGIASSSASASSASLVSASAASEASDAADTAADASGVSDASVAVEELLPQAVMDRAIADASNTASTLFFFMVSSSLKYIFSFYCP
jgi:hypothetical protein